MLSLSPSSPLLNPISFSSPLFQNQTHLFNGTPSFISPSKPVLHTKTNSLIANAVAKQQQQQQEQGEEEKFRVLTATRSEYNNIVILESENAKVLLLDDSGNVHSMLYKHQKWTNSYWDEFCSLPAIIPKGPVAIFGLGGGTVAHQLLEFWPCLIIDGWELDEVLIDRARMFFGISELETRDVSAGDGILRVHTGDALSPAANVAGGYAGIVVDLFANAEVLPELEVAQTWLDMKEKLMPDGRIMVNCGGAVKEVSSAEREWEVNSTIRALCEALGDQSVNWKKMPENESGNYLALTGPLPDFVLWSDSVPEKLSSAVKQWRTCRPLS